MRRKKMLEDLKGRLERAFPGKIRRVILYGSQAGRAPKTDSDTDILVVVNGEYDWRLINRICSVCYEIDLAYDVVTDVKVISADELETPKGLQSYVLAALDAGVAA